MQGESVSGFKWSVAAEERQRWAAQILVESGGMGGGDRSAARTPPIPPLSSGRFRSHTSNRSPRAGTASSLRFGLRRPGPPASSDVLLHDRRNKPPNGPGRLKRGGRSPILPGNLFRQVRRPAATFEPPRHGPLVPESLPGYMAQSPARPDHLRTQPKARHDAGQVRPRVRPADGEERDVPLAGDDPLPVLRHPDDPRLRQPVPDQPGYQGRDSDDRDHDEDRFCQFPRSEFRGADEPGGQPDHDAHEQAAPPGAEKTPRNGQKGRTLQVAVRVEVIRNGRVGPGEILGTQPNSELVLDDPVTDQRGDTQGDDLQER